jgi:uncharacterized peroxidase-related enzyme
VNQLRIHGVDSAPPEARQALERASAQFGFLPNLLGKLANAPAALEAYLAVSAAFNRTSLNPLERQVVLLTTSVVNRCPYCVAAHSMIAGSAGADPATVDALREGREVADERLEALRRYTEHLVLRRGQADPRETQRFLAAGFEAAQIYEIITGITLKTLSNYADHVELIPLDAPFKNHAWTAPEQLSAAK